MNSIRFVLAVSLLMVSTLTWAAPPAKNEHPELSGVTTKTIDAQMGPLMRMMTPTAQEKARATQMGNRVMACLYGKKGSPETQGCPQFKQVQVTQEDKKRARSLLEPIGKADLVDK